MNTDPKQKLDSVQYCGLCGGSKAGCPNYDTEPHCVAAPTPPAWLAGLREEILSIWVHDTSNDVGVPMTEEAADAIMQAFGRETGRLVDEAMMALVLDMPKLSDATVTLPPPLAGETMKWRQGYKMGAADLAKKIAALIASYRQEGMGQ